MTTFLGAHKVKDPEVIRATEQKIGPRTGKDYTPEVRRGTFRKILTRTGREHAALKMLIHGEERFAPYRGDGALITEAAYAKFNSPNH
jgi:hypothetical protein